ncbi:hypothetical protein [Parapedobacter indicus]|uniref:Tetratricopeptide repeat protein n=1 Tax=Parapedobacter indicus TaxID=1477437 RepID=A0A1I3Q5Q3_9SPHI|nr:hypothetical protein [Parapedobacter indicus]PPL00687.1 hypothetical protein CLV26_108279 [Parapedobacter indicus]SFJ29313.1 hypothetical protein SAMN05444682_108278 [Parapedobacter indicus]
MNFWEQLTDGLHMHEVLLFVLGSLFFLVLLFLMVLYAWRKEKLNVLLLFFMIPIVMIGWPSIARIQINEAGIALENTLRTYESDPQDPETRKALQAQVKELEDKGVKNPKTLINMAKANYMLGNDRDALQTLDKIPEGARESVGADDLKSTILVTQDIERKLQQAEQAPTDDNLEILRISKDKLLNKAANNIRLHQAVRKSDSLTQKKQ